MGAGVQSKLGGNTAGFAVVVADPDAGEVTRDDERTTLTSYDLYYYGVDVGFGSLDFDFKYMEQANKDSDSEDGFGAAITLNSSYYGLDGWT